MWYNLGLTNINFLFGLLQLSKLFRNRRQLGLLPKTPPKELTVLPQETPKLLDFGRKERPSEKNDKDKKMNNGKEREEWGWGTDGETCCNGLRRIDAHAHHQTNIKQKWLITVSILWLKTKSPYYKTSRFQKFNFYHRKTRKINTGSAIQNCK